MINARVGEICEALFINQFHFAMEIHSESSNIFSAGMMLCVNMLCHYRFSIVISTFNWREETIRVTSATLLANRAKEFEHLVQSFRQIRTKSLMHTHTHTHTHMHARTHVYARTHACMRTHTHTCVHTHTHTCVHAQAHTHTHSHMQY